MMRGYVAGCYYWCWRAAEDDILRLLLFFFRFACFFVFSLGTILARSFTFLTPGIRNGCRCSVVYPGKDKGQTAAFTTASHAIRAPLPCYACKEIVMSSNKKDLSFCVLWSPLPPITWLIPVIGHLGIADSNGTASDFQGPYVACLVARPKGSTLHTVLVITHTATTHTALHPLLDLYSCSLL
jgi:hypothetical protein